MITFVLFFLALASELHHVHLNVLVHKQFSVLIREHLSTMFVLFFPYLASGPHHAHLHLFMVYLLFFVLGFAPLTVVHVLFFDQSLAHPVPLRQKSSFRAVPHLH